MSHGVPPPRSNATPLRDHELLLLDFLFDKGGTSFRGLSAADYPLHMNVAYSHALTDDGLEACLRDLAARGLVTLGAPIDERAAWTMFMTRSGGALWELERQPAWDRYVESLEEHCGDNRQRQVIRSPSHKTAEQYLAAARRHSLFFPQDAVARWSVADSLCCISWRTFECVHSVELEAARGDALAVVAMERERVWWSATTHLAR